MSKLGLRLTLPAAALLGALAVACGGGGVEPQGCGGDGTTDPCAPDGRCLAGACVANAAPAAAFTAPAGLQALALAELDGSASADPDAPQGDAVVAWDWSFTAAGGACAPPVVNGHGSIALVRFGCAGHYQAQLVVRDRLGRASEPATLELEVAEGSSLVQLGPDQVLNHRCAGDPASCSTDGADPTVTATTSVATVGTLHYTWTARAPAGGELGPTRLVTFPLGAPAGSTRVHLETQGYLIVDDWPIDVEVSDDAGPLGTASTRLSVGNRPPRVKSPLAATSVDHTFASGFYQATAPGAVFEDPDGDALSPASTGSTTCPSFTLASDGTAQLSCRQALNANNLGLATFVGTFAVAQQVTDPWDAGSGAATTTAVTIRNRPVGAASSTVHVSHACEQRCCKLNPEGDPTCVIPSDWGKYCYPFTAAPHPSLTDPDGDPVLLTWTSGGLGAGGSVCALASCAGSYPVPGSATACGGAPSGTASGTFTASDGLTTSAPATLTLTWGS